VTRHRLTTARDITDRKTPMTDIDPRGFVHVEARSVWPSVDQLVDETFKIAALTVTEEADDSAHVSAAQSPSDLVRRTGLQVHDAHHEFRQQS
jgi:hypothetical protein